MGKLLSGNKAKKKVRVTDLKQVPGYRNFCLRYRYDFIRFVVEVLGKYPTWQQHEFMEELSKPNFRVSVVSGHGCHEKGHGILMYDGSIKNVEDVKVGDKIMGDDGTVRNVLSLKRGREKMFRIVPKRGEFFIVNQSHILSLKYFPKNRPGEPDKELPINITVKEYLDLPEWKKKRFSLWKGQVNFKKNKLPINPYLLGLFLGDGCLTNAVSICTPDQEIIEYINQTVKEIGCNITVNKGNNNSPDTYTFVYRDRKGNPLREKVKELGLFGKKSGEKFIPGIYKTSSLKDRLALLAGLVDTDGSNGANGTIDYVTKSKQLALDLQYLVRSCGLQANIGIKVISAGKYEGNLYYRLTISGELSKIPCLVARKKTVRRRKQKKRVNHSGIKSIEELKEDFYYGFELDGNQLYQDLNYTVHHNSGKTFTYAAYALWQIVVFPESTLLITGSNITQLQANVFRELEKLYKILCHKFPFFKKFLVLQTKRMFVKGYRESWQVSCRTAPKNSPENLAGMHGDKHTVLCDESSNIPDNVIGVLKGALTGKDNSFGMVSQGTRNTGHFYDSHHALKGIYKTIRMDSELSPIVSKQFIREKLEEYGGFHSPEYQIKVKGGFPGQLEGRLISRSWAEECNNNKVIHHEEHGLVIVCDVAGYGRNNTVYLVAEVSGYEEKRRLNTVELIIEKGQSKTTKVSRKIVELYHKYEKFNPSIGVDANGVGQGVYDNLVEANMPVARILSGQPSTYKDRFRNLRAEWAWWTRDAVFNNNLSFYGINNRSILQLIYDEFANIPYSLIDSGAMKLWSKERMAKEHIQSPDTFDAYSYAMGMDYVCISEDILEDNADVELVKAKTASIMADLNKELALMEE